MMYLRIRPACIQFRLDPQTVLYKYAVFRYLYLLTDPKGIEGRRVLGSIRRDCEGFCLNSKEAFGWSNYVQDSGQRSQLQFAVSHGDMDC